MLFSLVFGHKASVHTSDAPSPAPSLRNYTSDLKNALARAHTHTNTQARLSPFPLVLPLLLCELPTRCLEPERFCPAEAAVSALPKPFGFSRRGGIPPPHPTPRPAPGLEVPGPGTAVSKTSTLHPAPTWDLGAGSLGRGCRGPGSWAGRCRDWATMALHEVFVRTRKK